MSKPRRSHQGHTAKVQKLLPMANDSQLKVYRQLPTFKSTLLVKFVIANTYRPCFGIMSYFILIISYDKGDSEVVMWPPIRDQFIRQILQTLYQRQIENNCYSSYSYFSISRF